MAGSLQFDLVSPERRLASFAATEVQIPGAMGDMTAMEGHASTITSLRPGPKNPCAAIFSSSVEPHVTTTIAGSTPWEAAIFSCTRSA